ncbi:hypothetical protein C8R41DRAFT_927636 [Lentinula lateritia]|uniref:Uncharacterized protein n=1 Tax=Lentinula lateritia TaxID=40482 RepID=A0ABQ8UXK5_9AGAR|nr:hypothetical protein C8R41DRAFT_927636 [Lentinula lateritia]
MTRSVVLVASWDLAPATHLRATWRWLTFTIYQIHRISQSNHLLVNEKALLLKITTDSSASTLVFSRLINSNEILRIQRMEMLLSFIPYGAAELQTVSVFES